MTKAANPWTGLDIMIKEATMPKLNAEKRVELVKMFGETRVVDIENSTRERKDLAEMLGVKESDFEPVTPVAGAPVTPDPDPKPDPDKPVAPVVEPIGDVKELIEATKAITEVAAGFKDFKDTTVKAFEDISTRLEAIEASEDTKVRALLKPKEVAAVNGYRASASPDTKVKDGDPAGEVVPGDADGKALLDQIAEEMDFAVQSQGSPI